MKAWRNPIDPPSSRTIRAPTASLPSDLPWAGLQILGRPRDEATVVALGAAFERVSGWNGRTPDLSGFG